MPYRVRWLIPDQVIYQELTGHVTQAEYHQIIAECNLMMDETPSERVHIISDNLVMERSEVSFRDLRDAARDVHPKLGYTLVIQPTSAAVLPIVNMVVAAMGFFMRTMRMKLFSSQADAIRFLAEQEPDLAPLLGGQDS